MTPVVLSATERLCGDARSLWAGSQQCRGLRVRPNASPSTRCPSCASIFDGTSVPHRGGRVALGRRLMQPSTCTSDCLTTDPSTSTRAPRIRPRCTSKPANDAHVHTEFIAETLLPTRHGKFRLRGYRHTTDDGKSYTEPSAIISGKVEGREDVLCRVHDACFTSEVLGSLKCDCSEQLTLAMQIIQERDGIIIYLQQEGRGIGLANKIAAYALQEKGLDTVDANRALGLPDDCREYSSVKNILRDLGIKSIRLVTNNPRKISELTELGVEVTSRVPCIVQAGAYNEGYLSAKQDRMAHMLGEESSDASPPNGSLNGEFCYWNHEGEPGSAGIALGTEESSTVALGARPDSSSS